MDHALIKDILGSLLAQLELAFDGIETRDDADMVRVEIQSSNPSRIIGWHGETLNSIQHVLKSIIREKAKLEKAPFLVVDVDGYRTMQEDKVKKIAEQKADFVRRTGSRVALAPMSPYFRRIVHLHIANDPQFADLTTESIGEGDYRQIVLKLKKQKKSSDGEEMKPVMAEPEKGDDLGNLDI
ncbi:KH domain-containing protein [Candidatus Peregrinibacteria bacterium]|nr:KH domain-containing protein [Candidatus Peregrinibacteria bacterium]